MENILITGANGQLGRALSKIYPDAKKTDSNELDITDAEAVKNFDWNKLKVIINTAAYTDVDGAQSTPGGAAAWSVNDKAVGNLAEVASKRDLLLIHISSDYVFDGSKSSYTETETFKPLGVYGQTKAAGDQEAAKTPKHYIVRTSSVIGDGKNFVRTMLELGKKGVAPRVVANQTIRPAFTNELARAIKFLIDKRPAYGTYNATNEGQPVSWANFTRAIFKEAGFNLEVIDITYEEYSISKSGVAPRPLNSVLDLTKIKSVGFKPREWQADLKEYIKKELNK